MILLPIVDRELRVAARKRSTYLNRMTMAIIAFVIIGWIGLANAETPPAETGRILFYTLAGLLFLFASVAGIWASSDCLSEEKREGTLGLLFLTDLKGYDVVLGKLAATSLAAFYGMLAAFPVLAVPLLMGGVEAAEFWRAVLVALNLLIFSLTTGLLMSAICRDDRKANGGTLLLIVLVLAATPALGVYFATRQWANDIPTELLQLSPAHACWTAFHPWYGAKGHSFWTTTFVTQLYSWIFFLLACQIAPRSWQDRPAGNKLARWKEKWGALLHGARPTRAARRGKLLEITPFLWLAARSRSKSLAVWLFLIGCAGAWIWTYHFSDEDRWWDNPMNFVLVVVAQVGLKGWMASEGSRRFCEDRRNGALELLLSTPLPVKEILRGQRLALQNQFAGPVVALLFVDLVFMMSGVSHAHGEDAALYAGFYLVCMILLIADLEALSWVSMWLGLISQKSNRAAGGAVARVVILPAVVYVLGFTFLGLLDLFRLAPPGLNRVFNEPAALFIIWAVLSLANNVLWRQQAKRNLLEQFREIATQPEIRRKERRSKSTVPPVLTTP